MKVAAGSQLCRGGTEPRDGWNSLKLSANYLIKCFQTGKCLSKKRIYNDLGTRIPTVTTWPAAGGRCGAPQGTRDGAGGSRGCQGSNQVFVCSGLQILGTDNPNQIPQPMVFVLEAGWDDCSEWLGQD